MEPVDRWSIFQSRIAMQWADLEALALCVCLSSVGARNWPTPPSALCDMGGQVHVLFRTVHLDCYLTAIPAVHGKRIRSCSL